jgi:hypothetical protein
MSEDARASRDAAAVPPAPTYDRYVALYRAADRRARCAVTGVDSGARWTASVEDFSALCLNLSLGCRLEPGALLHLRFGGPAGEAVRPRAARVLYATPQPDGLCVVGCALEPELSPDEIRALRRQ